MFQPTLSQAITGFELAARARHLSPHTLADYRNTLTKLQRHLVGDPLINQITKDQIIAFLGDQTVSNKTVLNYHTGLSSFYNWALEAGLVTENLLHQVERPKPQKTVVVPLTEQEIRAILAALAYSSEYTRPGKRASRHRLPEADRNHAVLLLLLDTGIRASELTSLPIHRVDLKSAHPGVIVHGKGNKDRQIPISARTAQALWRYLATRPDARSDDPLFVTDRNRALDRTQLRKMLNSAGVRAGVQNVHPHRFRHTFAINFLRNEGDIYSLQMILGHTTLDMVKTYLQLAQVDLQAAHRKASPVDRWRL